MIFAIVQFAAISYQSAAGTYRVLCPPKGGALFTKRYPCSDAVKTCISRGCAKLMVLTYIEIAGSGLILKHATIQVKTIAVCMSIVMW